MKNPFFLLVVDVAVYIHETVLLLSEKLCRMPWIRSSKKSLRRL